MRIKDKSDKTPLIKNQELCEKYGFTNLLIKDESKNPFGTYKDRRNKLVIEKAKKEHVDKLVLITSGNAGYSLARYSQNSNIKIICIIDKNLKKSIKNKLKQYSKIIEVNLSERILKPEEVISLVRENDEEVIWDVTNGYHKAYEKIVEEINHEDPDFIILPMGSGEAFVGFYNGIRKLKLKTKLIGVGVKDKWNSYADKLHTPWTPYKSKIQSILKEGHKIIKLDEEEIKKVYKEISTILDTEPSSSVVFGVLSKLNIDKDNKIILINSGKGLF
ncbi:PLP-dependent lyase/thiolase [Candidatus Pacearchaeota archaeon]|nr:PLP-dependent lyase/thiolase [Candidatus Pacearchaeota archaeon]